MLFQEFMQCARTRVCVCHTGLEGGRVCQVFCVCLVLPASVQFWSPTMQVTHAHTHLFTPLVFLTFLIITALKQHLFKSLMSLRAIDLVPELVLTLIKALQELLFHEG